jgi:predicted DNA-binding protein (UPF0251 family)
MLLSPTGAAKGLSILPEPEKRKMQFRCKNKYLKSVFIIKNVATFVGAKKISMANKKSISLTPDEVKKFKKFLYGKTMQDAADILVIHRSTLQRVKACGTGSPRTIKTIRLFISL